MRLALPGGVVCVMLVVLGILAPEETWGRVGLRMRHCTRCRHTADLCVCPSPCFEPCPPAACATTVACPPVSSSQTTMRPVYETQYVQKPVLTKRNVQETCYRQERYVECVPQTVCENVTVDEGCYKMVWCPKVVTKQVAKTVMTQRPACRTVPYTVNREVVECTTHTVPVQTVRYIPETKTVTCVTSITTGPSTAPVPVMAAAPVTAAYQAPNCAAPVSPTYLPSAEPTEAAPSAPAPAPRPADSPATMNTVPEPVSPVPGTSYYTRPMPVTPRPQSAVRPAQESLTTAVAPSAAAVWRNRGGK